MQSLIIRKQIRHRGRPLSLLQLLRRLLNIHLTFWLVLMHVIIAVTFLEERNVPEILWQLNGFRNRFKCVLLIFDMRLSLLFKDAQLFNRLNVMPMSFLQVPGRHFNRVFLCPSRRFRHHSPILQFLHSLVLLFTDHGQPLLKWRLFVPNWRFFAAINFVNSGQF